MKKAARIAKKQEARLNRECRKQDKLLVWKKGFFRCSYYRTRAGYGMAGIPRRIQKNKTYKMMELVWAREAANAALYADPWSWRI
jgi:hypothetical protein